jgi:hypothetical protein
VNRFLLYFINRKPLQASDIFEKGSIVLGAVNSVILIVVGEHRHGIASNDDTRIFIRLSVLPNQKSSCASVLMMEATDMRNGHDCSLVWRFD